MMNGLMLINGHSQTKAVSTLDFAQPSVFSAQCFTRYCTRFKCNAVAGIFSKGQRRQMFSLLRDDNPIDRSGFYKPQNKSLSLIYRFDCTDLLNSLLYV